MKKINYLKLTVVILTAMLFIITSCKDDDYSAKLPGIVLTTTKPIGSTIMLKIDADEENKQGIWIDLNNNGIKEGGESIVFGTYHDYTILSQTITVYGEVRLFMCNGNQLTNLIVTKNEQLEELWCFENQLTNLDVTKNEKLEWLYCYNNQLTELDVTKNKKLEYLWCKSNQLTSLDVTKNEKLIFLSCNNNQLTNLDVTKNEQLETFWCQDNPITCIKVNQTQLDNIPTYWGKPPAAVYSLTCN